MEGDVRTGFDVIWHLIPSLGQRSSLQPPLYIYIYFYIYIFMCVCFLFFWRLIFNASTIVNHHLAPPFGEYVFIFSNHQTSKFKSMSLFFKVSWWFSKRNHWLQKRPEDIGAKFAQNFMLTSLVCFFLTWENAAGLVRTMIFDGWLQIDVVGPLLAIFFWSKDVHGYPDILYSFLSLKFKLWVFFVQTCWQTNMHWLFDLPKLYWYTQIVVLY